MSPGLDLVSSTKALHKRIRKDGKFFFADFSGEYMPDVVSNTFRIFTPHKPEKNRIDNGIDLVSFDMYRHTVFDYPSIIQAKLGGRWSLYNRLISAQVGLCNFHCWYCYVPEDILRGARVQSLTSEQLVESYLKIRANDKAQGLESNVLRISGGEPFLAPDLVLECLEYIQKIGLQEEVFVWSETNLSPFIKEGADQSTLVETWLQEQGKTLEDLARFNNFALHPCLHGITPLNLAQTTLVGAEFFDRLVEAFRTLVDHRIDIYPTISSNTSPSEGLEHLFWKLKTINEKLPLRFALIEDDLDYPPVDERLSRERRRGEIYGRNLLITRWSRLLEETYGCKYAEIPRKSVDLRT